MNNAINNHSIFAYDDTLIEKIRQILQQGLEKLKAFVKTRKESKFTVYNELDEKFNEIAQKLEKCEILNDEFNYFISIKEKILYIIFQNCENNTFGHCDYALDLFDFFIEIWNSKIEFLTDEISSNNYKSLQKDIKKRYGEYISEYYLKIDATPCEFSDEEMYNIHKSLRE